MAEEQQQAAIRALLETARKEGKPDAYIGKRRWTRYRLGMPLEVASDPSVPGGSWRVLTHNVSGGGLGFWSKQVLTTGEAVFVREWSEGKPSAWLSGHVTYSVLGINGYLVGVSFDHPSEPDAAFDVRRFGADSQNVSSLKKTRRSKSMKLSLRRHCAYSCASGAVLSLAIAAFSHQCFEATIGGQWTLILAMILAAVIGGSIGWFVVWRESRALAEIQQAIERLATGIPSTAPLPEPQTQEVAALRQAALDLARLWTQHSETERLQRERLEEISQIKSNVLSMVSHDLRTPLTSIQMYAQMLDEDLETIASEDQHHFLGIISEESVRLSRLVDDLLEVQRAEAGTVEWVLEPHDISETIRAIARMFEPIAAGNNIDFLVSCPDKLPEIQAHPDKLSQVINNLLSNALKFSPPGGSVRLTAEARTTEIIVRVSDTGPGIPRDKWDEVFDRFVQLPSASSKSVSGAGLGLFIARQIVEKHGGRIWLDSELGQGTEFVIGLPLEPKRAKAGQAARDAEPAGQIVVCDADPALAAMMAQTLREANFDVRLAHSGRRLLEHLSQSEPHVVITDIALPDMKAMDLFDSLKDVRKEGCVFIVHAVDADYDELRQHRVDLLLRRPVSPEDLVQATRIAAHKRKGGGAMILIANAWGMDSDQLCQHLSAHNHMVVVAPDVAAAVQMMRDCAFDVVVTKVGAEGALSQNMNLLAEAAGSETRVVALSNLMNQRECQAESGDALTYLPYTRGAEETAAAEINEWCRSLTGEKVL